MGLRSRRAGDLTFRGIIPLFMTRAVYPYLPTDHRHWVEETEAWSAERAKLFSLRAAIRRSRLVREVRNLWRHWVATHTYEQGPDGVYREVERPDEGKPAGDTPTSATQFKAGLLLGLAVTLGTALVPALRRWVGKPSARRRR